jgi:hypothetical protein
MGRAELPVARSRCGRDGDSGRGAASDECGNAERFDVTLHEVPPVLFDAS